MAVTPRNAIPRRSFLKSSVAALSATALAPSAMSQVSAPASQPRTIKAGMLGAAHSHALGKLRILAESPRFDLVGVCETDESIRARILPLNIPLISEKQLLSECELVVVEGAVRDLPGLARRALEAGRHVHLEKPGAATLAEFQEIVKLARSKRRLLQLGYMWRFNPGFQAALEAARQGWLGEVFMVRATMNTLLEASKRAEWGQFAGGALFEQGCHLIDAVVRLLGRPSRIHSILKTHGSDTGDLADNTLAVFEYPKALAIITNSTLQPNAFPHRSFSILGSGGTALVKPIEQPVLQMDLVKAAGPYRAGQQTIEFPAYRRYAAELEEMAGAIASGAKLSVDLDQEQLIHEVLLEACGMAR